MTKEKSLYNVFCEIYQCPSRWSYYRSRNKKIIDGLDFMSCDFSRKFIEQYFRDGKKYKAIEHIDKLPDLRLIHMVSVFFIGIYLYEFLKVEDHKEYEPSFNYLWFLTCLYHDFGYIIENDIDDTWLDNINYDVYEHLEIPNDLTTYYDAEIIKRYSEYRHNVDHGIEGGRKLYDLLKRNYYEHQERWAKKNRTIPIDDFEYPKGIWFRKRHEKYYAEAALNIMLHNIWFVENDQNKDGIISEKGKEETDAELYRKAKLDKLIGKKIKFTYSCALLFVLIYADTLEPVKKIHKSKDDTEKNAMQLNNVKHYKDILDNIFISTQGNKLILSFNKNRLSSIDYPYDLWVKDICVMREWTDVKIENIDNRIIIDFHADNN